MNPFTKIVPAGYMDDDHITWFRYLQHESEFYGGWRKLLWGLRPRFFRSADGWMALGPGWLTRKNDECEDWRLFSISYARVPIGWMLHLEGPNASHKTTWHTTISRLPPPPVLVRGPAKTETFIVDNGTGNTETWKVTMPTWKAE